MYSNPLITNPAELALPYVNTIDSGISEDEERILVELDRLTALADMHTLYFAQVCKALAIPISFEADKPVSIENFGSLTFEGKLATYSVVKIGRILGGTSVRALCLSFNEVTLLPFCDNLPDDLLLHVPVLAVDSISRST
jgi:hypothetical protein